MASEQRRIPIAEEDGTNIIIHGTIRYGKIKNECLDEAVAKLVYETNELINTSDILEQIKKEKKPGADYTKQKLGKVVVEGYDGQLKDCDLLYLRVGRGGIKHSHEAGEYYFVEEGEGILTIEDQNEKVLPDHLYPIPPNKFHAVSLSEDTKKLGVLVFKFSPKLIADFKKCYTLRLQRE